MQGKEFHLVRFADTSLGTLKNILLPGNFATISIFSPHVYLAPFIWLDTRRKIGSLIFFFSDHQLALLVPHFERWGSLSGYDHRHHGIRAARGIFQKHVLGHVMPRLQVFHESLLSVGSHPNTTAWCSRAPYFSDLISHHFLSKRLFWL